MPLAALLLALSGCGSPETSRARGGGPGADVGNRKPTVHMHEGARVFEHTPKFIPGAHPSLAPASQADQLSRR